MALTPGLTVRPIDDRDRAWLSELMQASWGADFVVVHDEAFVPSRLPGFMAFLSGEIAGLLTYRKSSDRDFEIVTLESQIEKRGVGSELIRQVEEEARKAGVERLWLVTTNDNVEALGFYQRRGFRLVRVDVGAVERARRRKPSIPMVTANGIPIMDELKLEKRLTV